MRMPPKDCQLCSVNGSAPARHRRHGLSRPSPFLQQSSGEADCRGRRIGWEHHEMIDITIYAVSRKDLHELLL